MGIRLAIVGTGAFARCFIPLFKAHPLTGQLILCDHDAEKLKAASEQFEVADTLPDLDAACDADIDAIALFTQNWLHGPQAAQALRAGKHVYSAVPLAITMEEVTAVVDAVRQTGNIYMIGETSYYYPGAIYCRQQFNEGAFGRIVYAEAEYYHDFDHGLYDVARWRGGADWKRTAGSPPMFYPTHSVGMVLGVTDARFTHVSCFGFVDEHADGLFRADVNQWGNVFSNESALFKASDGSACRINECRRIGHPGCERMSIWGTEAGFEHNWAGYAWVTKDRKACRRLDDQLACGRSGHKVEGGMEKIGAEAHLNTAPIHPVERLPASFRGLPNGHAGSHQFLVDDFMKACEQRRHPPNNVWRAARYLVPGLIAHESARRGGELLPVPDFGDPPAGT